jgi:hypothetical protein
MIPPNETPILRRVDAADGLSVTLTRTLLGTWRVVFCDDDAERVIESRVFSRRESAEWYASTLIPRVSPA